MRGWHNDNYRHSLARRYSFIRTKQHILTKSDPYDRYLRKANYDAGGAGIFTSDSSSFKSQLAEKLYHKSLWNPINSMINSNAISPQRRSELMAEIKARAVVQADIMSNRELAILAENIAHWENMAPEEKFQYAVDPMIIDTDIPWYYSDVKPIRKTEEYRDIVGDSQ